MARHECDSPPRGSLELTPTLRSPQNLVAQLDITLVYYGYMPVKRGRIALTQEPDVARLYDGNGELIGVVCINESAREIIFKATPQKFNHWPVVKHRADPEELIS